MQSIKSLESSVSKMTKTDLNTTNEEADPEVDYDTLVSRISPIANPLATRKMCKKLYKTIKKANKAKKLRRGVMDVQKCIRKGETGFMVLAGDVTPLEVYCHLPAVCEEKNIPYCFVPSKKDLGASVGSKKTCVTIFIKEGEDYKENYDECIKLIKSLPPPI